MGTDQEGTDQEDLDLPPPPQLPPRTSLNLSDFFLSQLMGLSWTFGWQVWGGGE